MPVDEESGTWTPLEDAALLHPLMPPAALLRKVAMIVKAAGVVVYETEHAGGRTDRMLRALTAIIKWQEDPQVVAWLEKMIERGELSRDFLK